MGTQGLATAHAPVPRSRRDYAQCAMVQSGPSSSSHWFLLDWFQLYSSRRAPVGLTLSTVHVESSVFVFNGGYELGLRARRSALVETSYHLRLTCCRPDPLWSSAVIVFFCPNTRHGDGSGLTTHVLTTLASHTTGEVRDHRVIRSYTSPEGDPTPFGVWGVLHPSRPASDA
jgi:hypothetical protein